jgi:zinc transporter 1/2/3
MGLHHHHGHLAETVLSAMGDSADVSAASGDGVAVVVVDHGAVAWFKVKAFVVLLVIGIFGGLLPLKARDLHANRERYLALGNTFSGGLFLCAGFSHMLGEAIEGFAELSLPAEPPLLLCLFGILTTLFVEKVLLSYLMEGGGGADDSAAADDAISSHVGHSHAHGLLAIDHRRGGGGGGAADIDSTAKSRALVGSSLQTYMLTILLSLHSIIEGVALGVEENIGDASRVLMAIAAHKAFAAFALGLSLVRGGANSASLFRIVILFGLMSPAGVVLGALFTMSLADAADSVWSSSIQAFAAGSFVYVALVEILLEEFAHPKDRALKFVLLLLGVAVMLSL